MKIQEIPPSDYGKMKKIIQKHFFDQLLPVKQLSDKTYIIDHRSSRKDSENFYMHPHLKAVSTKKQWEKTISNLFKNHEDGRINKKNSSFL